MDMTRTAKTTAKGAVNFMLWGVKDRSKMVNAIVSSVMRSKELVSAPTSKRIYAFWWYCNADPNQIAQKPSNRTIIDMHVEDA